jgi:dTDP-glucose pyrophosphorylase
MADMPIRKGVVLATGDGDRMGALTSIIPNVLLTVLCKPLILYPIEALVREGIRDIGIVIGHLSDKGKQLFAGTLFLM